MRTCIYAHDCIWETHTSIKAMEVFDVKFAYVGNGVSAVPSTCNP